MNDDIIEVERFTKSFGDVKALTGVDLRVARGGGRLSGCSAPTAPARPPPCVSWRPCCTLTRVARPWLGSMWSATRRSSAGSLALRVSTRRSIRTSRVWRTSRWSGASTASPSRRRGAARRTCSSASVLLRSQPHGEDVLGGMRRRLDLGASLVGHPQVLFLDEPTTGLDSRSRLGMWDLIHELVNDGTILLLTTQYLDEVDELSDRIAVIDGGSVIAEGTVDELKDKVGGAVLDVKVENGRFDAAAVALAGLVPGGEKLIPEHSGITLPVGDNGPAVMTEAVRRLDAAEVHITDLAYRKPTLDDVFLTLTGHVAEESAEEGDEASQEKRGRRGRSRRKRGRG